MLPLFTIFNKMQSDASTSFLAFKIQHIEKLANYISAQDVIEILKSVRSEGASTETQNNLDKKLLTILAHGPGRFTVEELTTMSFHASCSCPDFAKRCFDLLIPNIKNPLENRSSSYLFYLTGRYMDKDQLLSTINKARVQPKNQEITSQFFATLLTGVLDSERFTLFEECHRIILSKFSATRAVPASFRNKTDGEWDSIQMELEQELIQMKLIYDPNKASPEFKKFANSIDGESTLRSVLVDIMLLLRGKNNVFNQALDQLSDQLAEELNNKEAGLADSLATNFPLGETEMLMNFRVYPKADQLNPNNKKTPKKYSVLKNILCENLQKQGLIGKDLGAPDKYLGFVTNDQVSTSGIFTEAFYTTLDHGKLSHLIQWYCIGWAVHKGELELQDLSLPLLLEATAILVDKADQNESNLWSSLFDMHGNNHGYRSPLNVFQYLLTSQKCIGNYMRASFDHQLEKMLDLYNKTSDRPGYNKAEITKSVLFHHAMMGGLIEDTFQPGLNMRLTQELTRLSHEYYADKKDKSYEMVEGGKNAAIIKTFKKPS